MDIFMQKQFLDCPAIAKNNILPILKVIDFKKLTDMRQLHNYWTPNETVTKKKNLPA